MSRRRALGLGAAALAATVMPAITAAPAVAAPTAPRRLAAPSQAAEALMPSIRPRSDWAGDLGVTGEIVAEDDVRFLLVHHTASPNDYGPDEVADQIRGFHAFHTGPEKGWPDVAYNFFIDRHGGLWEGRQGSLAGPVRGDATGGSQGFGLLCSLIGDFTTEPMPAEMQTSLVALLAWLGETYQVDTAPGATVSFTSRGSNRWPAGTDVTAATISGHRDMSLTSCPGDAVYTTLAAEVPAAVTERRLAVAPATTTTAAPPPETETSPPPTSQVTTPPSSSADTAEQASPTVADDSDDGGGIPASLILAGGVGAAVAGGAVVTRLAGREDLNRG